MTIALTRRISPSLAQCQLTYLERDAIDVARAQTQHAAYEHALRSLGAEVVSAPGSADCPDCVFVEDTALVLDEIAVIAAMRRASRASETRLIRELLGTQRDVLAIEAPGTLEGGDAFLVGRTIFIGLSTRTNEAGVEQLRCFVEPLGYRVVAIAVTGCLHLTTGSSAIGEEAVLVNPAWVDAAAFKGVEVVPIDPGEPWAANTLRFGGRSLLPDCFPKTRELLESRGVSTCVVDIGELMKAEAGLTCMSLLFEGDADTLRRSISQASLLTARRAAPPLSISPHRAPPLARRECGELP